MSKVAAVVCTVTKTSPKARNHKPGRESCMKRPESTQMLSNRIPPSKKHIVINAFWLDRILGAMAPKLAKGRIGNQNSQVVPKTCIFSPVM